VVNMLYLEIAFAFLWQSLILGQTPQDQLRICVSRKEPRPHAAEQVGWLGRGSRKPLAWAAPARAGPSALLPWPLACLGHAAAGQPPGPAQGQGGTGTLLLRRGPRREDEDEDTRHTCHKLYDTRGGSRKTNIKGEHAAGRGLRKPGLSWNHG
jgi:hypothetical protein